MNEVWEKFENWLKSNFSAGFDDLNGPATDAHIQKLEETILTKLPDDFVRFLKIHNGQAGDSGWIINGSELLSTERIMDEWGVWNGILKSGDFEGMTDARTNGVKDDWWNAKWIPFTYDGGGNHLCIDLDPSHSGSVGQVITMWHDDPEREVQASSFGGWFEQYVDDLIAGKYVYSEAYEAIVNVNDV